MSKLLWAAAGVGVLLVTLVACDRLFRREPPIPTPQVGPAPASAPVR